MRTYEKARVSWATENTLIRELNRKQRQAAARHVMNRVSMNRKKLSAPGRRPAGGGGMSEYYFF